MKDETKNETKDETKNEPKNGAMVKAQGMHGLIEAPMWERIPARWEHCSASASKWAKKWRDKTLSAFDAAISYEEMDEAYRQTFAARQRYAPEWIEYQQDYRVYLRECDARFPLERVFNDIARTKGWIGEEVNPIIVMRHRVGRISNLPRKSIAEAAKAWARDWKTVTIAALETAETARDIEYIAKLVEMARLAYKPLWLKCNHHKLQKRYYLKCKEYFDAERYCDEYILLKGFAKKEEQKGVYHASCNG